MFARLRCMEMKNERMENGLATRITNVGEK